MGTSASLPKGNYFHLVTRTKCVELYLHSLYVFMTCLHEHRHKYDEALCDGYSSVLHWWLQNFLFWSKTWNIILIVDILRVSCTHIYTMGRWLMHSLLRISGSEEHTVSLKMKAVHSSEAPILQCICLKICVICKKENILRPLSHWTEKKNIQFKTHLLGRFESSAAAALLWEPQILTCK